MLLFPIGVVWINGCSQPSKRNKLLEPNSARRRCSDVAIESRSAGSAKPGFLAVPLLLRHRRWTGAVVQDNCETYARTQSKQSTPTHSEHRWCFRVRLRIRLRYSKTNSSYLVDPASSHMLVLKIKPCMSKYKHLYRETANGSLKQLWFI